MQVSFGYFGCYWFKLPHVVLCIHGMQVRILDVQGVELMDVDSEMLGFIRDVGFMLGHCYPERQGLIFIVNVPSMFYGIWRLVSPFIRPVTRKKIKLVPAANVKEELLQVGADDLDESGFVNNVISTTRTFAQIKCIERMSSISMSVNRAVRTHVMRLSLNSEVQHSAFNPMGFAFCWLSIIFGSLWSGYRRRESARGVRRNVPMPWARGVLQWSSGGAKVIAVCQRFECQARERRVGTCS